MRFLFLSLPSLFLLGCAPGSISEYPVSAQAKDLVRQAGENDTEGLEPQGTVSKDAPSISADFRAQENGAAEAKIVGGTKVPAGEHLDTVGIGSLVQGDVGCTGVLIAPDVVLTAAHCVTAGFSARVYIGHDRDNWQAVYPVSGVEHGLMPRHVTADCQPAKLKCARDIAVLVLAEPVKDVQPRMLAPDDLVDSAISYRAVGFGRLDVNARVVSQFKREARVTAVSNACLGQVRSGPRTPIRSDEVVYDCMPAQEIVAGQMRDGTDTCRGDSGGPLLVGPLGTGQASANDQFALAGLTSRATSQSRTICGDGGVYERLNPGARAWIEGATGRLRAQREAKQ